MSSLRLSTSVSVSEAMGRPLSACSTRRAVPAIGCGGQHGVVDGYDAHSAGWAEIRLRRHGDADIGREPGFGRRQALLQCPDPGNQLSHGPAHGKSQTRGARPESRTTNLGCSSGRRSADRAALDQLSSRRRNAISCSSSRAEAATGMATSAPMMPSRLPPISTATRVTVAGTCTVRPITLGTMK